MGWGLAALGVGSFLGSFLSSRSQSKAAKSAEHAAQAGVDVNLQMFRESLARYEPYHKAGVRALPHLQASRTGAISPWATSPTSTQGAYAGENALMHPAGGSLLGGPEATPSAGDFPTVPSPDIKFEFDPEDQMYKIQREEGEEAIEAILAKRGLHDSRPGINVLADFNRKLIAEETGRQYGRAKEQYGREYTGAIDRFNVENVLAQQHYGKYLDLVKLGAGAAGAMGQSAAQTGSQITSGYGQMQNALTQQGQAKAGMWQDIGGLPINILAANYYGQKAGLWS